MAHDDGLEGMHRSRAEIEGPFVISVVVDQAGPFRAAPLGNQIGRIKPCDRAFEDWFVLPLPKMAGISTRIALTSAPRLSLCVSERKNFARRMISADAPTNRWSIRRCKFTACSSPLGFGVGISIKAHVHPEHLMLAFARRQRSTIPRPETRQLSAAPAPRPMDTPLRPRRRSARR